MIKTRPMIVEKFKKKLLEPIKFIYRIISNNNNNLNFKSNEIKNIKFGTFFFLVL